MRNKAMYAAVLAAGVLATVGSSVAFADTTPTTSTGSTTTVTTTTEPPTTTTQPPVVTPKIELNPTSVQPGGKVNIRVTCSDPKLSKVTSPVFDAVTVVRDASGHQPWRLTGVATVRGNAPKGNYVVSVTCGDKTVSTTLTVIPAQVVVVPKGPAQTGDGSLSGFVS